MTSDHKLFWSDMISQIVTVEKCYNNIIQIYSMHANKVDN